MTDAATPSKRTRKTVELDRAHLWLTAPLLTAMVGLLGTGIGAFMQMNANNQLERHKFEYSLIQKAMSTSNRKESAQNLRFLLEAGLLDGLNEAGLRSISQGDGERLPIFLGAAIRDQLITVSQAKGVLAQLGFYKGDVDNEADLNFHVAVMKFQRDRKLDVDGLIGPKTVLALWEACPECPGLLQITKNIAASK